MACICNRAVHVFLHSVLRWHSSFIFCRYTYIDALAPHDYLTCKERKAISIITTYIAVICAVTRTNNLTCHLVPLSSSYSMKCHVMLDPVMGVNYVSLWVPEMLTFRGLVSPYDIIGSSSVGVIPMLKILNNEQQFEIVPSRITAMISVNAHRANGQAICNIARQ